jgi:ubiquitin-conjugating enzyme E2 W
MDQAKQKLPPGISIAKADDFREWQMDIRVLDENPIYKGEIYRLSFIFGDQYPIGMAPGTQSKPLLSPIHNSLTTSLNKQKPPKSPS